MTGAPTPAGPSRFSPSRRDLLRLMAFGSVAVGAAACGGRTGSGAGPTSTSPGGSANRPVVPGRTLVVVELGGGNDGWSTVVPYESGRYRDLRPTLAIGGEDVVDWGDGWGVNRRLKGLVDRGLTAVSGVGTTVPDLSHFEMFDRWHQGEPDPVDARRPQAGPPTGFLGRLCDAAGNKDGLGGISLGWGDHPSLRSAVVPTAGLGVDSGSPLTRPPAVDTYRRLLDGFTSGTGPAELRPAVEATAGVAAILDLVDSLPPVTGTYPDTDLGLQMALASRMVMGGQGIRVVHVPMGAATFDTHSKHAQTHGPLMDELDGALSAFHDDMARQGAGEQVLVCTVSEFGRRPQQNGDGLDHGTASSMLMIGPTVPGHHGDPSPVDRFDELGDLVATVEFDRYFATMAEWLEVDPARVLPARAGGVATPIPGLLSV